MLDKFKKKLLQEYQENMQFLSEKTVKMILKKDLGKKAMTKRKLIKEKFKYYCENYIYTLKLLKSYKQKYIYDDFKKKTDKFSIDEEIEVMEGTYAHLVKHKFLSKAGMRGINIIPLQNTLDKWKILNDLFREYPKRLKHLSIVSKTNSHDGLNIDFMLSQISEDVILLGEDFGAVVKEIKKDKDGHVNSKPSK